MMNLEALKTGIWTAITVYGGRVLLALLVFIIGRMVISWLTQLVKRQMLAREMDATVQPFVASLVSVGLTIMLMLSCAGILGVETTSFVAVLASAGLAIGLALQGSLANFAGGVLMLIFKPFRVGDLIVSQGFTGVVEAIQIFNTVLVTPDNKTIFLPNGPLSTNPLTNITAKGEIRVDMTFAAGSQNKIDDVLASVRQAVTANPYALKDRAPDILVNKLTDNAVVLDVRVWTRSQNFWDTYYNTQEQIKRQFEKDNIKGPRFGLELGDLSAGGTASFRI